jgi:hypothetical protein
MDVFLAFQNATRFELDVESVQSDEVEDSSETAERSAPELALPRRPTITLLPRPHPQSYFLGHMVLMPRRQKAGGYFIFDG